MLWAHNTTVFDLRLDRSMGCVIDKTKPENMTSESSNNEGRRTKISEGNHELFIIGVIRSIIEPAGSIRNWTIIRPEDPWSRARLAYSNG